MVASELIDGTDKGKLVLYTLSTCMWCKMTKDLLKSMGVRFEFVDVDTLKGPEKDEAKKEVKKWNPDNSYPTLVINDAEALSGFSETAIREKLK